MGCLSHPRKRAKDLLHPPSAVLGENTLITFLITHNKQRHSSLCPAAVRLHPPPPPCPGAPAKCRVGSPGTQGCARAACLPALALLARAERSRGRQPIRQPSRAPAPDATTPLARDFSSARRQSISLLRIGATKEKPHEAPGRVRALVEAAYTEVPEFVQNHSTGNCRPIVKCRSTRSVGLWRIVWDFIIHYSLRKFVSVLVM